MIDPRSVLYFILLYQASADTKCPLQCRCQVVNKQEVQVLCKGADFQEIPDLPMNTSRLRIWKGKLKDIQAYAFRKYPKMSLITIETDVATRLVQESFKGPDYWNLETLDIKSYSLINVLKDTFRHVKVSSSLNLRIKNPKVLGCVCSQVSIYEIDVSYNGITNLSFPTCWGNFRDLGKLSLNNNILKTLEKDVFNLLEKSKLREINLNYCSISKVEPGTFRKLFHLRKIFMSGNKITVLPSNLLQGLYNLQHIQLTNNQFHGLPCNIFRTYLPRLETLNFNGNHYNKNQIICEEFKDLMNLTSISLLSMTLLNATEDTFSSIGHVAIAKLSIRSTSSKAFSQFKELISLNLIGGGLTLDSLRHVIQGLKYTHLKYLKVESQVITILTTNLFNTMKTNTLESLIMAHCGIATIERGAFDFLNNLKILDLTANEVSKIPYGTFKQLEKLQVLYMSKNKLTILQPYEWSLQPSMESIHINKNLIRHLTHKMIETLPNITYIDLNFNKITVIKEDTFKSKSLKFLYLRQNKLNFNGPNGLPFAKTRNLEILKLEGIKLSDYYEENTWEMFFTNMSMLKTIDFSNGNIKFLPLDIFKENGKLEDLNLSLNKIKTWRPETFKGPKMLKRLFLSSNQIMTVSKEHFHYLNNLQELHLERNPLICDCNLLWFRDWIANVYIYIPQLNNPMMYKCAGPEKYQGMPLLEFNLPESDCKSYIFLKLSVTFMATVALVLLITAAVYWYRFEINLFFFHMKTKQARLLGNTSEDQEYDGYVVYAAGDLQWIIDSLIPEMEDSRGYKLCIEDRDWQPGAPVIDNIMRSIEASRKILLLISPNFTMASWCEEVLEISQGHLAGRNRNSLIPVVLQEPEAAQMTPALRSLLSSITCIYWPKISKLEKRFWKALHAAMKN